MMKNFPLLSLLLLLLLVVVNGQPTPMVIAMPAEAPTPTPSASNTNNESLAPVVQQESLTFQPVANGTTTAPVPAAGAASASHMRSDVNINRHVSDGQAFLVWNTPVVAINELPDSQAIRNFTMAWWLGPPTYLTTDSSSAGTKVIDSLVSHVIQISGPTQPDQVSGLTRNDAHTLTYATGRIEGTTDNSSYYESVLADADDYTQRRFEEHGTSSVRTIVWETSSGGDGNTGAVAGFYKAEWIAFPENDTRLDFVRDYVDKLPLTPETFLTMYKQVYDEYHQQADESSADISMGRSIIINIAVFSAVASWLM